MTTKAIQDMEKQVAAVLGLTVKSVGKTHALQNFLPLVDGLNQTCSAIEITDHEMPVAMLLSYNHWIALVRKLTMHSSKGALPVARPDLMGSVKILGDLEQGRAEVAALFASSIEQSAEKL